MEFSRWDLHKILIFLKKYFLEDLSLATGISLEACLEIE